MKGNGKEDALFAVANAQGGYFTAYQARLAGFSFNHHPYFVKSGNWIREWRGVYRLARYPLADDALYSLWGVWSMNRKGVIQGIYSYETALALFDLTDLQPDKFHMTLPRGNRRFGEIPAILDLHHADICEDEFEERPGYRVTRPFRTIVDLVRNMTLSPEFIRQAVDQALERGQLSRSRFNQLLDKPRVGARLKSIMDGDS